MQLTKETLFKPTRAESKMFATDLAARIIADKETEARMQKTERLRDLRLAKEAELAKENPTPKPSKAGKGRTRRRISI